MQSTFTQLLVFLLVSTPTAQSKKLLYVHGDTQVCNSQNDCLFQDDEIKNLLQENNFKPSIETNRIDAVLSFDPCQSYSIAANEHWRSFPIFEVPLRPLLDCTPHQLGIADGKDIAIQLHDHAKIDNLKRTKLERINWIRNIDENYELNEWRSNKYPNIIPLMQFTNKRLVSEMSQVAEYLNLLYEQGTFQKLIIGFDQHIVQDWEMERMRMFLEDVIGTSNVVKFIAFKLEPSSNATDHFADAVAYATEHAPHGTLVHCLMLGDPEDVSLITQKLMSFLQFTGRIRWLMLQWKARSKNEIGADRVDRWTRFVPISYSGESDYDGTFNDLIRMHGMTILYVQEPGYDEVSFKKFLRFTIVQGLREAEKYMDKFEIVNERIRTYEREQNFVKMLENIRITIQSDRANSLDRVYHGNLRTCRCESLGRCSKYKRARDLDQKSNYMIQSDLNCARMTNELEIYYKKLDDLMRRMNNDEENQEIMIVDNKIKIINGNQDSSSDIYSELEIQDFFGQYTKVHNVMRNKHYKISTTIDEPFVFFNVSECQEFTPGFQFVSVNNDINGFCGFSIDILKNLAERFEFTYELKRVGSYGAVKENKDGSMEWNGIVGEIVQGNADFSISAMTITPQREKVVDFTQRYMDYAVSVLMKRIQEEQNLWTFLDPFEARVWISILFCMFMVSLLLYVLNRISPKRMKGPRFHDTSLHGTCWFVYSSLVQQSTDLYLVTASAQIVTGVWWFFILIVVSSYTAKLASFLTIKNLDKPFESFAELSRQNLFQYGTVVDTSVYKYIEKRATSDVQWGRMYDIIKTDANKINTSATGYDKVRTRKNFAFLWDVAAIDYMIRRDCNYATITDSIFHKGYGFAVRKGEHSHSKTPRPNPVRNQLSMGILELEDEGELDKLKEKYWPEEKKNLCESKNFARKANKKYQFGWQEFMGIYIVLAAGMFIGTLVAIYEVYSHINKGQPYPPKDPKKLPQEVAKDLTPYLSVQRWKNNDLHIVLKDAVCSEETQNTKTQDVNERLKLVEQIKAECESVHTDSSEVLLPYPDILPNPSPSGGLFRRISIVADNNFK